MGRTKSRAIASPANRWCRVGRESQVVNCPSWIGGVARSAGVVVQGPNRDSRSFVIVEARKEYCFGNRTTTPAAASPQPPLLSRRGNCSNSRRLARKVDIGRAKRGQRGLHGGQ